SRWPWVYSPAVRHAEAIRDLCAAPEASARAHERRFGILPDPAAACRMAARRREVQGVVDRLAREEALRWTRVAGADRRPHLRTVDREVRRPARALRSAAPPSA